MKRFTSVLFFLSVFCHLSAQIRLDGYKQEKINPELFNRTRNWEATWISVPGEPENEYGIYHFRKTVEMEYVPEEYIVHVSADNRYKLYVNGTLVSLGPARGNLYNWNFETIDLSPFLKKGKNVLAAVVWNFAEYKPFAQISFHKTGFILQGNTPVEKEVNTNSSWLCLADSAYQPWNKPVIDFYTAGPGDFLDARKYPWGWEQPDFDDSGWKPARDGQRGAAKGARDYPGRLLVPSPIPPMEMNYQPLTNIRLMEGMKKQTDFLVKKTPLTIPSHSHVRFVLDNDFLTTGYLSLLFSNGKDAEIRIGYAEAFYDPVNLPAKGNRNEISGKTFIGYEDKIIADGGIKRTFTPLWWRTWRYINLEIITSGEPLVLEDIYSTTSFYPFEKESTFSAPDHNFLQDILNIGWHTARLCANETYMDCPYYEQLQYFGDTRIQAMITMYNTRDKYLVKNALEQGRQSIVADGITMSRYPSEMFQFIPSFSLLWICMAYDYWMYRGDEEYIKTLLSPHRGILAWYEQQLNPDYSLHLIPHWFFTDWTGSFEYGEPPRQQDGSSAVQDILYIMTLEMAAQMEEQVGLPGMAAHYRELLSSMREAFYKHYWVEEKGLFADTKDHSTYSQHVNSLVVLVGLPDSQEAQNIMQRVVSDASLAPATIYFTYYVNQALNKVGMGDLLTEQLGIWKEQLGLGLTTWAEEPEPSRSDCHAWGASPNIEFYRILLGIDSDAPGFRKIRIAPNPGTIRDISGSIPHPEGTVSVKYEIDKKGNLTASIRIPETVTGSFCWKGEEYPLSGGKEQVIKINK
ncbi:MAG: alpha-L-rhamnosidase N-terminal domain-containing protein [Candidatus Azobacteroides sp.]|nr:alpha-L-rhamnosidase N-terminal domain-containing protein [Candidatus Azobacteroides sp.]